MAGLIRIPSSWSEPAWELYCDPTALPGAGSGNGSSSTPYTDFAQALNQAKTQDKSLGIRTGRTLDVSSLVNLTTTSGIYAITAYSGLRMGAWQVDSDVPSIFQSAKLIGTAESDWEKVDVKDGAAPGTVVAVSGVYDAYTSGPEVWHYTGTISASVTIAAIEYGTRGSTASIITPANYKQSGIDSEGVEIGWLADSGASNCVVNTSGVQRTRFTADMQWCHTDNGGLLVASDENPATRWGGVYVYQQDKGILHIQECPDFSLQYAFQGQYVGKLLHIRNNNDEVMDGYVLGLAAENYGRLLHLTTDNRSPNFGSGSTGTGSIDMTAGTNTDVFGDGTEPWLEVEIEKISGYYGLGGSIALGWLRNCKLHDIDLDMQAVQGQGGVFFAWSAQAPMGSHNEIYDFTFRRCHNGAGRFGRTDWGVGFDGPCGSVSLHDGTFRTCAGTIQMAGARRNQTLYNVRMFDVLRGPYLSDELDDGNGSHQLVGVSVRLDDPANWNISQHPVASADWTKAVACEMRADLGYPPRGHQDDTDTMTKNDGVIFHNFRASIGTCPASSAYGIRNETINAAPATGPWHSTGVSDGDDGEIAENGESVAPGQEQEREQLLATIGVIGLFGFDAAKRIVDADYADASGTQTVGTLVTDDPAETSDGFLTDDSPATLRTGGTALDATTVDTDIDYTRVAVNTTDMRGIPRYSKSVGPLQWIPRSPTTRTNLS